MMAKSPHSDPATKPPIIVGTAGHIDHGKSTLIEALTGTDPDRLAEEKRRGITIELGFAHLDLPDGTTVGIVDVPGHEKFIRQMISGASGIDLALICIAADDGIMPQTREHIAVLQLLGIENCVIALTKCDTVDQEWIDLVKEEIRDEFSGTVYGQAPIVAVSARRREGLDELKHQLASSARAIAKDTVNGPVRLPIDRVFTIKGAGTVITGTLWQGEIRTEDELELLPSHRTVRVRAIQVHGQEAERSVAGLRTALNLAGTPTDKVRPGDILATPDTLQASDRFDARFTYLPVLSENRPFKSGTQVHIAHGTREVTGRLLLMNEQPSLQSNETAYAQIRLDEPLAVSRGDHFIVRLLSPARVIGGGVVLNGHPRRRTTLKEEDTALLNALSRNDDEELCSAVLDASATPVSLKEIQQITGLYPERIECALKCLLKVERGASRYTVIGKAPQCFFARKSVIQKLIMTLENALLSFHNADPSATGISKGALHQLYPIYLEPDHFNALLDEALAERKVVSSKGEISHPKASAGARALEEQTARTLASLLESYGKTPPAISDLFAEAGVDPSRGSKALSLLEERGEAQRVSKTLCFSKEVLDAFWRDARSCLLENKSATAAQLKDAMGTSRKYAIPLLEYFDDRKMTVRQQDLRVLPESIS